MAVPSQSPDKAPLEETGRKRTASEANDNGQPEAEGSPDMKKAAVEADPLGDLLALGEYPHNTRKTSETTGSKMEDRQQCLNYNDFEMEFGRYDEDLFVNQQEAEDLLATLESLQGRLASDTQPLPLEWAPVPMLAYEYPPMLGWSQDSLKSESEKPVISLENDKHGEDRSI